MTPKDILAILTASTQESVLDAADLLARRWQAHAAALHLTQLPDVGYADMVSGAMIWSEIVKQARETADQDRAEIEKRVARFETRFELRRAEAPFGASEDIASRHALHADLSILAQPEQDFAQAVFEGALFKSGRPVLLMPPRWSGGELGRRVLVAWNARREAARALADAAPFLAEAEGVKIVTVDAAPNPYGEAPGRDIAVHLARHGLDVELANADGMGRPAESVLLDEARAFEADIIVMGGYGHSRLREFVFGGVTRALSRTAPLPLLMSH